MKASVSCQNPGCEKFQITHGDRTWLARHGFYFRRCDSKTVERFRCRVCKKTISNQTFNLTYKQKKPRINSEVRFLLCSKMSMRRIAIKLKVDRKTVARKVAFLARVAARKGVNATLT